MRTPVLAVFASLVSALPALAAPADASSLSARDADIFRLIFSEHYCVLPAGTPSSTGCPVAQQLVGSTDGSDWNVTLESHEVSVVHTPCQLYTCEQVSIDGIAQGSPVMFGAGISHGYDFSLA